jgi:alpha-glucan,water dikinase
VWASKYNERALLSMKKVGLDFNDLRMAVLVQRVVPAEYAYVIHTHNPSNGSPEEIYAEVVKGLGESIVSGMVPGSSLSFMVKKSDLENPEVMPTRPQLLAHPRLSWPGSPISTTQM